MKPVIIIPAFQPGKELLALLEVLNKDSEQKIIVVDDGSTGESKHIFEVITKNQPQVEILHHAVNLGKGQALKTGFNHFLTNYSNDCIGVVTADADGQHTVEDILHVSDAFQKHPQSLCLGSRELRKNIPFLRLLGNKLTVFIFKLVTGVTLLDTQTGLRGIPADFLHNLLLSSESGYDFELDMLIRATKNGRKIIEFPIKTIYTENNKSSHFNYIRDSFKIYFVFLRFSILSLATAMIDYLVFALFFSNTHNILLSIIFARILAGIFQFTFGKLWVFKSSNQVANELSRYVILVVSLMLLSYGLITPMVIFLKLTPYLAKVIAEGTIFLLSFSAQNIFVYAPKSTQIVRSERTDWDDYYDTPFKTALVSRRFTESKLHQLIREFKPGVNNSICELGGGNSYFFPKLREIYPEAFYIIIDNNQRGLNMSFKKYADDKLLLVNDDVINPQSDLPKADLVFSIGLIEHFSIQGTARAIQTHFLCAKPGSLVIITFPTVTWLYTIARRLTMAFGAWRFPDERPLSLDEVTGEVTKYGEVLHTSINWPVIFTQGVVVVRVLNTNYPLVKPDFD